MSYIYKAFISYRHKPLDSSVAVKVQRAVEHYKVPKDLRYLTGGPKLGKVFRDEDELPLSSSLTDSIIYALDNSEFLIVVCSPDLPLSKWCEQEIRYFLSTHDRDHVLTVLAAGSSDESFSPLLLHEYDEDGNITADTEPLAANISADTPRKRWSLFAKEKYRILASLIGCAFDDLYRREQRYRRRRAAAFASAVTAIAVSFIGVLINRNAVIRKNYEQALRNQSVYLASESERLLSEGDRLSAIALAVEALPSEEGERPLVSRAEYALAKSVNAYTANWYTERRSNYSINNALKHPGGVQSFMLSDSGMLVSLTRDNSVTAWNTENSSRSWTVGASDYRDVSLVDILPDDTVVIIDQGYVCFLDGADGSVRYKLEGPGGSRFSAMTAAVASKDHSRLAVSDTSGIAVIDTASMEELCRIECEPNTTVTALSFSDDGHMIAAGYHHEGYSLRFEGIRVYDTESGSAVAELDSFSADEFYHATALFTEEDKLCVSYDPYRVDISGTMGSISVMFFEKSDHYLSLYDISSGEKMWEVSSEYYSSNSGGKTLYTGSLGDAPVFVDACSNFVNIVDAGTGKEITHAEYPSTVAHAAVYDGAVQVITVDGGFGGLNAGGKQWSLVRSFVGSIKSVIRDGSDYWIVQEGSDSILHCRYTSSDPSWTVIKDGFLDDETRSGFRGYWHMLSGDSLVVGSYSWDELLIYDPDKKEFVYRSVPGDSSGSVSGLSYKMLRYSDGSVSMLKSSSEGAPELWNISVTSDDREVYISEEDGLEFCDVIGDAAPDEWYGIVRMPNEGNEYEYYFASFDYEFNLTDKVLIRESSHAYTGKFWDGNGSVYVSFSDTDKVFAIDLEAFTVSECSGDFGEALASVGYMEFESRIAFDAASGITAVNAGSKTVLFDKNMKPISEIGDGSFEIISVSFVKNGRYLLALCKDNQIRRYDLKTGLLLSRCDVDHDCSGISPGSVSWVSTDSDFTIMMLKDECAFVINEDDWDISAKVPGCTAYLPSDDMFVLLPSNIAECEIGGFKRHTTESLIAYAREILGDWKLSEAQKMRYGID